MSPLRRLATALVLFLLPTLAAPCFAKEDSKPAAFGPVPAFTDKTLKDRRGEDVYYTISYPIFNVPFLDNIVHDVLLDFLDGTADDLANLRLPPPAPKGPDAWQRIFSYTLYSSKKGIVSLDFSTWQYDPAMPHGNEEIWGGSGSYDLDAGRQLTLADVFPKHAIAEKALPKLIRTYLAGLRKAPTKVECPDVSLDDIAWDDTSFLLRPEGMVLLYPGLPPSGGYCDHIPLSKKDLQQAGADMSLWEK